MKLTIHETKEVDAKFLLVSCAVRYWEDAEVDGVSDEAGDLIPCRNGDCWEPLIDLETGIITNWTAGKVADIHYKVCDAGEYSIFDANRAIIKKVAGYVPSVMCPEQNGHGDYVIMKVDASGLIANWRPSLKAFEDDED